MALPHRRQYLAKAIPYNDLTPQQVADYLGVTRSAVHSLAHGHRYPSPREIELIVKLFKGMPIENFFEESMLIHRDVSQWPPKGKGFRPPRQS